MANPALATILASACTVGALSVRVGHGSDEQIRAAVRRPKFRDGVAHHHPLTVRDVCAGLMTSFITFGPKALPPVGPLSSADAPADPATVRDLADALGDLVRVVNVSLDRGDLLGPRQAHMLLWRGFCQGIGRDGPVTTDHMAPLLALVNDPDAGSASFGDPDGEPTTTAAAAASAPIIDDDDDDNGGAAFPCDPVWMMWARRLGVWTHRHRAPSRFDV